jgi:hypothetical protein
MMIRIFKYLLVVIFYYKLSEWLDLSKKFTFTFKKFIKITIKLIEII